MRKPHRYDWFDKVQMWRGRAAKQRITRQLAVGGVVQYLFHIRRFTHCIEARTLSQMEYAPDSRALALADLAQMEYNGSAT